MTWVKLDDQFFRNPKAQAVGMAGRELYLAGLCFCASQLTDGRIPKAVVPILCTEAGARQTVVSALVQHGMWTDYGDFYVVHDWNLYNRPASEVKEERERNAERQRRYRSQRESQRDSRVTNDAPSRPVPSDVSNETSRGDLDEGFDAFWDAYPRKVEKQTALKAWRARRREGWDADQLIACAQNYARMCRSSRTQTQFIKHASRFLSKDRVWEEYSTVPAHKPIPDFSAAFPGRGAAS